MIVRNAVDITSANKDGGCDNGDDDDDDPRRL
jgi:hypothetical protein